MGNPRPTKVTFFRACYFCCLAVFCPETLAAEEKKDNDLRAALPRVELSKARHVHNAFWTSFGLIVLFGALGAVAGWVLRMANRAPGHGVIAGAQIVGASLLLWGTLFVRGFEIQTYDGVTLTERVNQWIYRAMYCVGTSLIVFSLVWSA